MITVILHRINHEQSEVRYAPPFTLMASLRREYKYNALTAVRNGERSCLKRKVSYVYMCGCRHSSAGAMQQWSCSTINHYYCCRFTFVRGTAHHHNHCHHHQHHTLLSTLTMRNENIPSFIFNYVIKNINYSVITQPLCSYYINVSAGASARARGA